MQEYLAKITNISGSKIVYVDETGLDKYFIRPYGRALRSEKVYGEVRGRKFERVSIVAGQNGREILSPLQFM